jgi:hypothetical protein
MDLDGNFNLHNIMHAGSGIAYYATPCVTTSTCVKDHFPDEFHSQVAARSAKPGVESPRKPLSNFDSVCHHNSHHSLGNDGYSYPSLGVESFQDNHGYSIIQS